jgi:hypothetical protein
MKISDLKKVLTALNKEELSEIIIDLYKSNKAVKDFLNYHLNISSEDLVDTYKAAIKKALNPEKNRKIKLAKARKILSDFKKIGGSHQQQAELMFFYINQGLDYAITNNYSSEILLKSLLSIFQLVLKHLQTEFLLGQFEDKVHELMNKLSTTNLNWEKHFDLYLKNYY